MPYALCSILISAVMSSIRHLGNVGEQINRQKDL